MERQEKLSQEHSQNIDAIKKIQKNLLILRSNIEHLCREEKYTAEKIQKVLTETVPLIRSKISQSEHKRKKKQWVSGFRLTCNNYRDIPKDVISRTQSFSQKKQPIQNKSSIIRQISNRNEEIITRERLKIFLERQKKSEKIKLGQAESRRKVQEFYMLKKYHIRKQRRRQEQELRQKILQSKSLMKRAQNYKQELKDKIQLNKRTLTNIKSVTKDIQQLDELNINEIINNLGLKKKEKISQNEIEKFLVYVEQHRKQNIADKENDERYAQV